MRRPRASPSAPQSDIGDRPDDGTRLPIHHYDGHRSSPPAEPMVSVAHPSTGAAITVHSSTTHHHVHHNNRTGRALRRFLTDDRVKMLSAFLVGACVSGSLSAIRNRMPISSSSNCRISFGTYHGKEYDTTSRVGSRTCLVESKFLKVQQHQVKLDGSGGAVIPDWLWIDYHDRINVLVEAPPGDDNNKASSSTSPPRFLVFEQTKYALEGRMSLAIVGGIIEPGEEPLRAARREVSEELHVACQTFHFLGRYRTDVNRGMGWTNAFLASQCRNVKDKEKDAGDVASDAEVVGAADSERQDVRTLSLTEIKEAVKAGRFLEIQWSATVALALLHLESSQSGATASH